MTLNYNYPIGLGPGISFNLERKTECCGLVDIEELIYKTGESFDVEKQREVASTLAMTYNEQLPGIPLWERYGNNPVLEGVRVEGWPPPAHWLWKQSLYADNPVVLMLAMGLYIRPVGWRLAEVVEVPKELEEAVKVLTDKVTELSSKLAALSSRMEELEGSVKALERASSASMVNASLGLSVMALVVAIAAIALSRRRAAE